MSTMRKTVLIVGLIIIGIGVAGLLYPFVGNYINSLRYRDAVNAYQEQTQAVEDTRRQQMLQASQDYNERLFDRSGTIVDLTEEQREEYESMLQVAGAGIMGYLDIPKIDVSLPIYHGTSEAVLQVGVGHLEGSSLPVGGENTHTVLSAHSGLPSKMLFTELDKMQIGDTFTINVLDDKLTYMVDSVQVLLPEDIHLSINEGEDVCTLMTCTPIGANTHRLLVHAKRVEQ